MCLDFDGTLAPIVDDPNKARPLPGTDELLAHLAARFAAVALLSGRPADYLVKHAAAPGVRYLGLYIAVLRAEDGVNPDPGRIVVGQTSEKTGTYNGTSQMSVVSR